MHRLRTKFKRQEQIPICHLNGCIHRSICMIIIGIFVCIGIIIGIILGIIGIKKQVQNRSNENISNQRETKCFVFQSSSYRHQCNYCDYNNSNCPKQICYDQKSKVSYFISNGTQILSTIIIKNNPKKQNIQVGYQYTCYYDQTNNIKSVKWEYIQPKSQIVIISVGIGLIVFAFVILALVGIYIIFIERPHLEEMKRRNQMVRHLSEEHKQVY